MAQAQVEILLIVQIPHNHAFASFFDFLAFIETEVLNPPIGQERGVGVA